MQREPSARPLRMAPDGRRRSGERPYSGGKDRGRRGFGGSRTRDTARSQAEAFQPRDDPRIRPEVVIVEVEDDPAGRARQRATKEPSAGGAPSLDFLPCGVHIHHRPDGTERAPAPSAGSKRAERLDRVPQPPQPQRLRRLDRRGGLRGRPGLYRGRSGERLGEGPDHGSMTPVLRRATGIGRGHEGESGGDGGDHRIVPSHSGMRTQ